MDSFLTTMLFALFATTLVCSSPLAERQTDISTESPTDIEAPTTIQDNVDDIAITPGPNHDNEFVIHEHEDEDVIEESADGVPEVLHRDIDKYIVEPTGEEYLVVSEAEDDLFDAAESGLVFRPYFKYRGVSRRRAYRTPIRRYYRRRY